MRKVAIEIKYPVWSIHVEAIEIEIPEGVDVAGYVYDNEHKILIEHGADATNLSTQIDLGYAGIRII